MAQITYTRISTCPGGCHVTFDISLNGGAPTREVFPIDDLRAPLAQVSNDDREAFVQMVLRAHLADKTRAQIVTEFASPVTVTI